MGGTSFDVALVWDAAPRFAEEKSVEFGIPIRVPHIDMTAIGAGGGSIARIDRGGMLRVGDRMKFAPFGVLGGRSGQPARIALVQNGVTRLITKETGIALARGDRILIEYPGGGGYGDPGTREVELVVRDVRRGYISRETARAAYGVVLKDGSLEVDLIATEKARRVR